MDKYSDSIGDFMVAMAMDEDLGNIKLLERVFTNIDLDNLDEVIERTKLYTGKELDDILLQKTAELCKFPLFRE